jgi:hypothetical protein
MNFKFEMKVINQPNSDDVIFKYQYQGVLCEGHYISSSSVFILNFFVNNSFATETFHILDENSNFYFYFKQLH